MYITVILLNPVAPPRGSGFGDPPPPPDQLTTYSTHSIHRPKCATECRMSQVPTCISYNATYDTGRENLSDADGRAIHTSALIYVYMRL